MEYFPISDLTKQTIQQLSAVNLNIAANQSVNIIADLKKTPRSGKAMRIDKNNLSLPKQSLLDHEYQVALLADFFIRSLKLRVDEQLLADIIASHDVAEVIIGDIPDFTADSHVFSKNGVDNLKAQEEAAMALILSSLDEPLKSRLSRAKAEMDGGSLEAKIFRLADKIEPIISIWRYIYWHKSRIDIKIFNEAMADFFINPNVVRHAFDEETLRLINYLQNKSNVEEYFNNGAINFGSQIFSDDNIRSVIESREIESV